MSINLSSIVDLVHPTPSGISVITSDQIWVLFDREIDETTLSEGNLFVAGPDFDSWSGPDLQLYLDRASLGDEDEILQSPGFHGFVEGTLSFQRISLSNLTVVTTQDVVGSGLLYRSKAILTPTHRLQVSTEYNAYLVGDEDDTDSLQTGISSRTVFDPVASGTNIGTGNATFIGGYNSLVVQDTYRINITTSGEVGTAKFQFHRDSDSLTVYGPFRTKRSGILLSDGVTVAFDEGIYSVGDKWSAIVKTRDVFLGNITWPFKTGSGSILTLPSTVSTSVIGDPIASDSVSTTATTFTVEETDPEDGTSNMALPAGALTITVDFNSAIDPTSVVSGVDISVYAESITGETDVSAGGELVYSPSVSSDILTIIVASGQLLENNLITVTLDKTIKGTNGITLGTDYVFTFSTAYNPLYCTLRQTRIRIGAFINEVADDTVNLAIHMASKEATNLTWNLDGLDSDYYKFARNQWTCCKAAYYLLMNTIGGSNAIKSKRLGDLEVSYNTAADINKPLQSVEDCISKWEGTLLAGGAQVQTPVMVIKGEYDYDKPPIGRGWLHVRDSETSQTPASNRRYLASAFRRYRSIFTKRGWWVR